MFINPAKYCKLIGLLVNNAVWIHGDQTSICTSQSMVPFVPRQILEQVKGNTRLYSHHTFQTNGYKYSPSDKDLTQTLPFSVVSC